MSKADNTQPLTYFVAEIVNFGFPQVCFQHSIIYGKFWRPVKMSVYIYMLLFHIVLQEGSGVFIIFEVIVCNLVIV